MHKECENTSKIPPKTTKNEKQMQKIKNPISSKNHVLRKVCFRMLLESASQLRMLLTCRDCRSVVRQEQERGFKGLCESRDIWSGIMPTGGLDVWPVTAWLSWVTADLCQWSCWPVWRMYLVPSFGNNVCHQQAGFVNMSFQIGWRITDCWLSESDRVWSRGGVVGRQEGVGTSREEAAQLSRTS